MKPFFSIVIPTYNSSEKVIRAIQSVLLQSYKDYEIIVVDDGSTDDTQQIIQHNFSEQVKYFYKTNGGPASARNVGIKEAIGEYICFLDADDEFMEEKLFDFHDVCTKQNSFFLFSDAIYFDEINGTESLFSDRVNIKQGSCFQELIKNNFIVASTVCIQKSLFTELGYFDESENLKFVEDYDLWLKVAKRYPLSFVDKALTKYYIHQTNNSQNVQRTFFSLQHVYIKWASISLTALKQLLKYFFVFVLARLGIVR